VVKHSFTGSQPLKPKEALISIGNSSFCQINLLLDQGSKEYNNERQHIWKYCIGIIVLLVSVVLSNAYKGDNIVQITSPLPNREYKTLNATIENDFKIYSSRFPKYIQFNYERRHEKYLFGDNITFVDYLKVSRKHLYK